MERSKEVGVDDPEYHYSRSWIIHAGARTLHFRRRDYRRLVSVDALLVIFYRMPAVRGALVGLAETRDECMNFGRVVANSVAT